MHGATVTLVALLTSALTATGTTYLIEKYDVLADVGPPREVQAPSLVGLAEGDARNNAQALSVALLIEGREPSAEAKPGSVLRQSVAAGQRVPEGSAVAVVIAEALPRVPGVVGATLDAARSALREAGYEVREGEPAPDDRVPPGSVATQSPAANAGLASGSQVTLIASSGPAELEAPKLMGLSLERAKEKLAELGLEPQVRWISRAETVTYVVLSQKPSPGERVVPKSAVEIVVNR